MVPDDKIRVPADNSESQGYQAAQALIERGEQFDGLFAGTDLIAIGAMRGFDDMPLAAYVTPGLTTMQQNAQRAGDALVEGIVHLIEGGSIESRVMAPKLIIRESCGAKT